MIKDRLKSFEYYKRKLPLYMQNTYGIVEHFKLIFDVLLQIDNAEDELLQSINIFDANYLERINNSGGTYHPNSSDILDKIAALYGYVRVFDVAYNDENNQPVTARLSLNNEELLMLIKAAVVQNNFDGSREMAIAYYQTAGLPIYMLTDNDVATCNVTLNIGEAIIPTNVQHLFRAGLLTIRSVGIKYVHRVADITSFLIWNDDRATLSWNNGKWA